MGDKDCRGSRFYHPDKEEGKYKVVKGRGLRYSTPETKGIPSRGTIKKLGNLIIILPTHPFFPKYPRGRQFFIETISFK